MKELLILLSLLSFNVLDALSDALRDEGKKTVSKLFEMLMIVSLLPFFLTVSGSDLPFLLSIAGAFILIRYGVFDYIYNSVRSLGVFYIGKTSLLDRFWVWFFTVTGFPKQHWLFWTRIIALIVGAGLTGVWKLI